MVRKVQIKDNLRSKKYRVAIPIWKTINSISRKRRIVVLKRQKGHRESD
jgi:hypothetical protein